MLHECGHPRSSCGFLGSTCGGGEGATSSSSSFSISNLFPTYTPTPSSSSSSNSGGGEGEGFSSYVDCTLSLGTPSTRHAGAGQGFCGPGPAQHAASLRWDVMAQPNKQQCGGGGGGGGVGVSKGNGGDAPRRCANCDTTSTPLWRNGPRGPKSLCNACGIRYKKEERRAATSSAVPTLQQQQQQQQWGCYGAAAAAKGTVSIAKLGDDQADLWRLNAVPAAATQAPPFHTLDRPSLFQYN